jgi:CTP:molybdopterin cytidylyltransferase MocA
LVERARQRFDAYRAIPGARGPRTSRRALCARARAAARSHGDARGLGPGHVVVARVACDYGEGCGAPGLFTRPWFDALASLTGDTPAKVLLREQPGDVALVSFPGGSLDVDRPADHARLLHTHARGA